MAQDSWPSPNHNSREVTTGEYEMLGVPADTGVVRDPAGAAVVTAGTGLQVVIAANRRGLVRNFLWTSGTTDVPLTISANASGSTRIDAVVLRLDRSTWDVRAVVSEGTPGSGPPTLTQDDGITGLYEVLLAYVTVPNSAASVTVVDRPQYLGTLVRVADDGKAPPNPALAQQEWRPNTGQLRMWTGDEYVTLYEDTGELSLGAPFNTWETVGSNIAERHNGWVYVRLWVKRVGSTFSRNDSDGGSKVGSMPSDLKSKYINSYGCKFSGSGGSARVDIREDGEIWVVENENDVTVGRHLRLTMSYRQL